MTDMQKLWTGFWGWGKKILIGALLLGAALGLAGTRFDHKNADCTASGKTLEGSQTTVTLMGTPIASRFNYVVTKGGEEVDRSGGLSIIFNVNENAQQGADMKKTFCATGELSTTANESLASKAKGVWRSLGF